MGNQPFHILLIDASAPEHLNAKERWFDGVKAPFVGETQAISIRDAVHNDSRTSEAGSGTRIALAFKGGQMDDQGIIWPLPVEDEYILGTVDWQKRDGQVHHTFSPRFDEEINPEAGALDAEMSKAQKHAEAAIATIARRVNGIKSFRNILRTRNPLRMLRLLLNPSEDPEDQAAAQILIGMGLLQVVEGIAHLTPEAVDVIDIANSVARQGPAQAAEDLMVGTDEIELDHV